MELSVIIVNFNAGDYLRKCLDSVFKATEQIAHEVFVVDNNSSDGSVEMIGSEFPFVKLIQNKINSGFSAANNQAIRQSTGQFVLILNPDTIVESDTFSKCIEFMNTHADAGAVGIKMSDGNGNYLPESKRAFPSISAAFYKISGGAYLFPKSKLLNRYYLPQVDSNETSPTEVISGAFMFIRREALDRSGLFDEDFFMYGEDIDLSYRLMKTGFKNYYFPEARIIHYKGKCTPRDNYKDVFHFYNAMRIYVDKRTRDGHYKSFRFILIIAVYFRELIAILNRYRKLTFKK
jgi:GT2 family glycosyltransferase